eukprot:c2508_g1_i1 orf=80-2221(-)
MGCSASTLDTEQSVTRCKNRKHYIKLAVRHRHAFAAAHAAYIQSLKNTGAAIRQFGEGEAKETQVADAPSNTPNPTPLKPPPLPNFLAEPLASPATRAGPISRAVSMPATHIQTSLAQNSPLGRTPSPNTRILPAQNSSLSSHGPLQEEDGEEDDGEASKKNLYDIEDAKPPPLPPSAAPTPPPPPPPKGSAWDQYLDVFPPTTENDELDKKDKVEEKPNPASLQDEAIAQEAELGDPHEQPGTPSKGTPSQSPQLPAKAKTSGQELIQILRELDDQFLEAFESGKVVAKLLEARKMHYHSNFADASDSSLDHSTRVLRVMSWGRNPHMPLASHERIDFIHSKEKETHASTLDKLLAWEKKLHDEVKAGEQIRSELERKSVQLRNQKKRDESSVTVNRTKAVVKSLQTRYLVEIQAVDAAASEVDKLRDDCLHNQLVDLVNELMAMWSRILECHQKQYKLIENMGSLDISHAPQATNDFHFDNTLQLESEVNLWHQNFEKLLSTQKEYMDSVYHWLRLHIIQIESDGKDTPGSPQKMSTPPVYNLCKAWLQALDQLPGNVTLHALKTFSTIIHELTVQQTEELKQKRKLESLKKDLEKKEQNLKAQEAKYNERRLAQSTSADSKEDMVQENGYPLKERERMVQQLRETVEIERGKYEQMCSRSGSMALSSIERGLPPVLKAIKEFAGECSHSYTQLRNHTLSDNPTLQISYEE